MFGTIHFGEGPVGVTHGLVYGIFFEIAYAVSKIFTSFQATSHINTQVGVSSKIFTELTLSSKVFTTMNDVEKES